MSVFCSSFRLLPGLLLLSLPVVHGAQAITSITIAAASGSRQVVISGNGFTEADVVTVAGIPLENISVTENRIEGRLPAGVRLVGGEYVVKVAGKTTSRGSLRITSEPAAISAKSSVQASN